MQGTFLKDICNLACHIYDYLLAKVSKVFWNIAFMWTLLVGYICYTTCSRVGHLVQPCVGDMWYHIGGSKTSKMSRMLTHPQHIEDKPKCPLVFRRHFQMHFCGWKIYTSIKISLKCVRKGPINNILSFVQIMASRRAVLAPSDYVHQWWYD